MDAAKLRSLYRSFLRELPPRPILKSPRTPLHRQLRQIFSGSATEAMPSPPRITLDQSEQYLAFLRAQWQYVTLLERYNPGIGLDQAERVRLTARRVGMDLPQEFLADDKD